MAGARGRAREAQGRARSSYGPVHRHDPLRVLARLSALTDDRQWRSLLDRQLATFGGAAAQLALYGATLFRAVDWTLNPPTRIEVQGPRGEGAACDMHLLALQTYRPRRLVIRRTAERPAATVCVGTTCSLPVPTPEALRALLG